MLSFSFHQYQLTPASFSARNIAEPPELSPRANGTCRYSAIADSASLTWFWPPWYLFCTNFLIDPKTSLIHNILPTNHTTSSTCADGQSEVGLILCQCLPQRLGQVHPSPSHKPRRPSQDLFLLQTMVKQQIMTDIFMSVLIKLPLV